MQYQQNFFYLCKTPLSAEGPEHVEIITRAENSEDFPRVFQEFEELRSHAFNEDKIYSVVRADDIYELVRTNTEENAKEQAYEQAEQEIITNLQHRVMQGKDANAKAILKEVYDIEG
jgi:MoaA/NifB/PqqE/SkfB family radical SAM enzyme